MAKIKLHFPMRGVNRNYAATTQPQFTSPHMQNVRPYDVLEHRARGGQRPGLKRQWEQILGPYADMSDWTSLQAFWRMDELDPAAGVTYDTGTVEVDAGTCTLSGGTWPAWAVQDGVLVIDSTIYPIISRDSDTELTVTGANQAALTAYALYRVPVKEDGGGYGCTPANAMTSAEEWTRCLEFVATSSDVLTGPANNALSLTTKITISAWVRIPEYSAGGTFPILSWYEDADNRLDFLVYGGELVFLSVNGGDHAGAINPSVSIESYKWHHVVATYDQTTKTTVVYLNGEELESYTHSTAAYNLPVDATGSTYLKIGYSEWRSTYLDGMLCNLMIFNTALTAAEVASLYSNIGSPVLDMCQVTTVEIG